MSYGRVPPHSREAIAADLRGLRRRLGGYGDDTPATPGGWSAAESAYDDALVRAAVELGMPDAPDPTLVIGRRRLTVLERHQLEQGLTAMGVDLRG
jgi:hypothetical protein